MRIFLISNILPLPAHHQAGAVSRVQYHVMEQFVNHGCDVALQCIYQMEDRRGLTSGENESLNALKKLGVHVYPILFRSDYTKPKGFWNGNGTSIQKLLTILFRRMYYFYPSVLFGPVVQARIHENKSDIVFIFWNSEGVAATYGLRELPKFVYYGVPDHLPGLARLENPMLFAQKSNRFRVAIQRRMLQWFEMEHLRLMGDCDVLANICAEHAGYYFRKGHPHSIYIQNMWPEFERSVELVNDQETNTKAKIVGSLGTLHTTGNTYGLKFIGEALLPRLTEKLGPGGYEIHIFGKGKLHPVIDKLLRVPQVQLRGWVEDIDSEIASAQVFLVANNIGPYRGSYTRIFHAWSLKKCCVAHRYQVIANPEMIHGENVLLGETPDEIAELIAQAVRQPTLRRKIGEGGWQTFKKYFTPDVVAGRLIQEMEFLVHQKGGIKHDN